MKSKVMLAIALLVVSSVATSAVVRQARPKPAPPPPKKVVELPSVTLLDWSATGRKIARATDAL